MGKSYPSNDLNFKPKFAESADISIDQNRR
jgi:hypothetical protein